MSTDEDAIGVAAVSRDVLVYPLQSVPAIVHLLGVFGEVWLPESAGDQLVVIRFDIE